MNSKSPRSLGHDSVRGAPRPRSRSAPQHQPQVHPEEKWNRPYRRLTSLPGLDYLMIRVLVFLLSGIGVVIVFSSSMAWSFVEGGGVWGTAARQAMMVAIGLCVFWLALKIHPNKIRALAPWLLVLTFLAMIAVLTPLGTGREEVGAQRWLVLGPLQLQPSELSKVAVAVWGAAVLADKPSTGWGWGSPIVKFSLVATALVLLNLVQGDLGTTFNLALMMMVLLIMAGVRMRWIWGITTAAIVGCGLMVLLAGGFRANRIEVFFNSLFGRFEDTLGPGYQTHQGLLSLADGSMFGVGLGQSRAKWFYLPEAKNDFIFAIIGEELGLMGAGLIIMLFAFLGIFGFRIALRAQNQFQSLMAATLTAGVVSQAFINIGYVIGLLPVTGIQLPMISAGGTSAIITLGSMGLLASCARHEPEAVSAMRSYGRPLFDRLLFLAEPRSKNANPQNRASAAKTSSFGLPITGRKAVPENGSGPTKHSSHGQVVLSNEEHKRQSLPRQGPSGLHGQHYRPEQGRRN